MTHGWHVGRQDIINWFYKQGFLRSNDPGVWRTIVKWKNQKKIIVRHDGNNRPFIIEREILLHKLKQSDKLLKNHP